MKEIIYKPLNQIWLKASVIGSVWASIEIVFGSFLHNLKVPMSGTVLSFISVYLLVAYAQMWRDKGLILRAGLICALMKSISPSAIIIGPMTGIFAEALLLELSVALFGRNMVGYIIGGSLAVFSALAHKAVSLLIYYGFDFVNMLSLMYSFAAKQLKLAHMGNPEFALLFLSLIYLFAGAVAAILGKRLGMKSHLLEQSSMPLDIKFEQKKELNDLSNGLMAQSIGFLFLHLMLIVMVLLLINKNQLVIAFILGVAYLAFCFFIYKNSLRRLKKVGIWVQFILITLFAAVVWNVFTDKSIFSSVGLLIGFKMIFRAMIIMIGFSAIGAELKNPSIKLILYTKGFKNFYHAIDLSFSALPFLISHVSFADRKIRKFRSIGAQFLSHSKELLTVFSEQNAKKSTIFIVTGNVHQGKTTFVNQLLASFPKKEMPIAGFLTIRNENKDTNQSYNLETIPNRKSIPFIDTASHENWIPFRRFYFNPSAFRAGNAILDEAIDSKAALVIIDEVGPLELSNKGWSDAIERLSEHPEIIQLWVVRKKLVPTIQLKWNVGTFYVVDISHELPAKVQDKLISLLQQSN